MGYAGTLKSAKDKAFETIDGVTETIDPERNHIPRLTPEPQNEWFAGYSNSTVAYAVFGLAAAAFGGWYFCRKPKSDGTPERPPTDIQDRLGNTLTCPANAVGRRSRHETKPRDDDNSSFWIIGGFVLLAILAVAGIAFCVLKARRRKQPRDLI